MRPKRLIPGKTALFLIDMQDRLMPVMANRSRVLRRAARLLEASVYLEAPVLVTEQNRRGLGSTVLELTRYLAPDQPITDKQAFSAAVPPVCERLEQIAVEAVVLAGVETHICVLQTALDLIERGLTVAVAFDAVSSRREEDQAAARERMVQAGVLPTTVESVIFELLGSAEDPRFRAIRSVIASRE